MADHVLLSSIGGPRFASLVNGCMTWPERVVYRWFHTQKKRAGTTSDKLWLPAKGLVGYIQTNEEIIIRKDQQKPVLIVHHMLYCHSLCVLYDGCLCENREAACSITALACS